MSGFHLIQIEWFLRKVVCVPHFQTLVHLEEKQKTRVLLLIVSQPQINQRLELALRVCKSRSLKSDI